MAVPGGSFGQVIFVVLVLVLLYYVYQFLFGPSGLEGKVLLNGIRDANTERPLVVAFDDKVPVLYEGGEYSVNFWIYIQDWSNRKGLNKHVLSIGGRNFLTLAVYLGPIKNSLQVRVQTKDGSDLTPGQGASGPAVQAANQAQNLSIDAVRSIFTNPVLATSSPMLTSEQPCDIPSVDLQKWVQVTVSLNNKTCDVYIDGKLARSCILPSFFKVDKASPQLTATDFRGFGGFISNISVYNYALNPEQVWRLYMSGPGPNYTLYDYVMSLFSKDSTISDISFPKKNIV